ncbi:MAG: hypothetical protein AAGH99_07225 [Planctomycetota bacterium]
MSETVAAVFIEADAFALGLVSDAGSRIERFTMSGDSLDEEGLRAWLDAEGLTPGPIVVGLASTACYAVQISTEGLPRLGREAAMRYRLEAKLPDDLETLGIRFIGPHRSNALAVAVRNDPWEPIVRSLENLGFSVQSLVPTALMSTSELAKPGGSVLVQNEPGGVDHLVFGEDGLPEAWRYLPSYPNDISRSIAEVAGEVDAVGVEPQLLPEQYAARKAKGGVPEAGYNAATRFASSMLSGAAAPVLDFMQTDSTRRRVQRAWWPAVAVLAFVSWGLGGLLLFSGIQQNNRAENIRSEIRDAYVELYPDQRAPAVVLPRLRSEAAVLTSSDRKVGQRDALADVLGVVLRMPDGGDYEVVEINADAVSLRIVGQADSLPEIDRISRALADHPAAVAQGNALPPTTQVMPSGQTRFEFTIDTQAPEVAAGGRP